MKKTALLFSIGGTLLLSACEQDKTDVVNFNITPNTGLSMTGRPTDHDLAVQSVITNTSNTDLNLTWVRSNVQQTVGWSNEVCDPVQCWSSSVNSRSFTLPANSRDTIVVHFYPHGLLGSASIDLTVYEADDPSTAQIYQYSAVAQ